MSKDVKPVCDTVHAKVGDTLCVEFEIEVKKGTLYINQVDIDLARDKIAQMLIDTFEWCPPKDEVEKLITIREKIISKLMKEIRHFKVRNGYLEPRSQKLRDIENMFSSEDLKYQDVDGN
jgi:hypothetical protein